MTYAIFGSNLIKASIVLLLGILAKKISEKIIVNFLERIKLKMVLKRINWEMSIDVARFISQLAGYFFIFLSLSVSFEILEIPKMSDFFETIVFYYPNIFVATFTFLATLYIIDFSKKIFVGIIREGEITYIPLFGKTFSFFLWIFASLIILYQLKVAREMILILFTGLVFTFSLVIGLSFGLAGKKMAEKFLKELEEKLKK